MWVRILNKYNIRGKDALFKTVFALYTLDKGPTESISDYMSRSLCLFGGTHGITFNTMANLLSIFNYDPS